jgi:hypothetical protein
MDGGDIVAADCGFRNTPILELSAPKFLTGCLRRCSPHSILVQEIEKKENFGIFVLTFDAEYRNVCTKYSARRIPAPVRQARDPVIAVSLISHSAGSA